MSSKDKSDLAVGQLLCGGFEGTGVTSQAYHLIVDHKVSTIILSKKNAVNVKQMTKLIRDLQYIAYTEGNYEYPIMFAIDQEGGMVNALFDSEYLHQFPNAMGLCATGDTELVYKVLKAIAMELRQIGFLIIFGPVLDVVIKLSHQLVGVRSFGTSVEDVVKYGKACATGFRAGGLLTFGKHFPGIGNASVDSLLELPMLADSLEQVKNFNAVPFAKLVKEGILDGISAAGCGVPTISPDEIHACLSPVLINQLLRNEIGFDGVVISECLEMDALHHSIGLGQGVILALYAGCDLILVCHETKLQDEAVESMKKALNNGNLDEEIVLASLARIEKLQKQLPGWKRLFPKGEESAKSEDLNLFRDRHPELWNLHGHLSDVAYRNSITLVRDYTDALPLTKFFDKRSAADDSSNNILLLTPLLTPIYKPDHSPKDSKSETLFNGEEVFKEFGNMLSEHPFSKNAEYPYNVLHTTYTANGLTSLHESLIENSKVVIVVTSEATRNMYQIGIVKYVSVLCGANPASFNNAQTVNQLSKPLILIATSSPYDFLYNKAIGSAYLCCYDYTSNALSQLASVLMGDTEAEGCIPGEKKYVGRNKKRRLGDSHSPKSHRNGSFKRRWLVDEFDLDRDWDGVAALIKNNSFERSSERPGSPISDASPGSEIFGSVNYQAEEFYKKFRHLLLDTREEQRHFVVRNSSLNIIYGVVFTWVNYTENKNGKIGSIMYLMVDKTKRLQSIGKNLHARAIRYLVKEQSCTTLTLGVSLPLIVLPNETSLSSASPGNKLISFMNYFGWNVKGDKRKKKHIMISGDLADWLVPKKIFRELMIVGVRFDICNESEKLMSFIHKNCVQQSPESDGFSGEGHEDVISAEEKLNTKSLYLRSIKYLREDPQYGVKIIIALEPTNQTIIGSIILFTNKSQLAEFYPFIDESSNIRDSNTSDELVIGAIIAPVIDLSYSNLTEIFRYGLICSGITFLKSSFSDGTISKCLILGVNDDKSGNINGMKEIGFHEWKSYYDYYDKRTDVDTFEKS